MFGPHFALVSCLLAFGNPGLLNPGLVMWEVVGGESLSLAPLFYSCYVTPEWFFYFILLL